MLMIYYIISYFTEEINTFCEKTYTVYRKFTSINTNENGIPRIALPRMLKILSSVIIPIQLPYLFKSSKTIIPLNEPNNAEIILFFLR